MTNDQDSEQELGAGLEETFQEIQEEVDQVSEERRTTPEAVRGGVNANGTVKDTSELASEATSVSSTFSRNIEQQGNLAGELEDMVDRARDLSARQNVEVHQFTANAEATGEAGVADEWDFEAVDYLEEDGELVEFAEEGDSLQQYAQRVSGEVQNQSAKVQTATTIMSERSDEIESTESEYDNKIESAEENLDEAIENAETHFENEVEDAKEDKEEAMEDIKDQIINQTDSDIEDSGYETAAEMSGEESREVQQEFRETKNALEEEKEEKIEEAKAEYESTVEELEEEREEELEDLRDEKRGWKDTKQEALQTRANALNEVESVHANFSEDVAEYVQDRAEEIDEITRTMGALGNMAGDYNENGIVNDEDLRGDFNLGQNGLIEDVENAAKALGSRALENIEYLEDAVEDYADVAGSMPDLLDEMDDRAGSRLDEVTDLYDQLGVDVDEDVEDEYGVEALRNRVKEHVEEATGEAYDSVDTFRRQIRAEAENPV